MYGGALLRVLAATGVRHCATLAGFEDLDPCPKRHCSNPLPSTCYISDALQRLRSFHLSLTFTTILSTYLAFSGKVHSYRAACWMTGY